MTKIVAVIPVRSGSTRVPKKGFRNFCGTTLLDCKIESLKQVDDLHVIVSTDSVDAMNIARKHGVAVHKREKFYASSKCTGSEFFVNLAESIDSEILVYSPPTSPFVKPETVNKAINTYFEEECDSVSTVFPVKHHMWLNGKPINYSISDSPNSQDLPDIQKITYGICINSNKNIVKCKNVVGNRPYLLQLQEIEAVDIDTMLDFQFAEFLYEREIKNV